MIEERRELLRRRTKIKPFNHRLACRYAHALTPQLVVEQRGECISDPRDIMRLDQQPVVLVRHQFGNARNPGADDRHATRHRFDQHVRNAVPITVFGVTCRCLTLDRLIAVKRAAGRPKDLEAIAELEAIREASRRRDPR